MNPLNKLIKELNDSNERRVKCQRCDGRGAFKYLHEFYECECCEGTGYITKKDKKCKV